MALFHRATTSPSKAEIIAAWAPTQRWGPSADVPLDVIGSYRFDDPEGQVGLETLMINAGDRLLQVPMTFRDEPLEEAAAGLLGTAEHSVLGTRWVYDGLHDPRYVMMLAAVAMTGQGEALGMKLDERWLIAPSAVRIEGGGWTGERVAVDGFEVQDPHAADVLLRNDRFELTFFRCPTSQTRPPIALTASWQEGPSGIVLARIAELPTGFGK